MKHVINFDQYDPEDEYKSDLRRDINLEIVRKTSEYNDLIRRGFEEATSPQQELNNTLKFIRVKQRERDRGFDYPFYTIHPSGTVRRYNPPRGDETPEGSGNVIKKFKRPFMKSRDYIRGLRYLIDYLERKEEEGDFK